MLQDPESALPGAAGGTGGGQAREHGAANYQLIFPLAILVIGTEGKTVGQGTD